MTLIPDPNFKSSRDEKYSATVSEIVEKDCPISRADIKIGSKLISINRKNLKHKPYNEVIQMLYTQKLPVTLVFEWSL